MKRKTSVASRPVRRSERKSLLMAGAEGPPIMGVESRFRAEVDRLREACERFMKNTADLDRRRAAVAEDDPLARSEGSMSAWLRGFS